MARTRHFPEGLTRHSYWLAAALPLLMPLAWSLREFSGMAELFAWTPLVVLYVILPLMDQLIGRDAHNPAAGPAMLYPDMLIPVAAACCYLAVLGWSLAVTALHAAEFSLLALAGWVLSLGNVGGVAGINVAHELIHRRNRAQQRLGGLLLACVWYPCFKIEHPRWHHVHVATSADPSSADRGSHVYRQVPRALWLNTVRAWKLGAEIARRRGRPAWRHEIAAWYALSAAITLLLGFGAGMSTAAVFVIQGLVAAGLLEIINFVEHYGLRRQAGEGGRYEPPGVRHSWDCDFWLSNAILIQLPRHADHHTHPSRSFSRLQMSTKAPLLPLGYPLLVGLSLVPALWRKIIHPLLPDANTENDRIVS